MNKDEKPLWMYWVLLAGFISPTLFIAGVAVGSSAKIPSENAWVYISAIISAIATFIIALLTIVLAVETWRLRRTQDAQINTNRKEAMRPHVEIFLESSIVGFQFIVLKVENIGRGIARHITFEIEGSHSPKSKSEVEIIQRLEELSFFANSLNALGVSETKKSFLFSFRDMLNEFGSELYDTKITFQIKFNDIEGNNYTSYSVIDLSEFKGITELGKGSPAYRTSIELENIKVLLKSVISGNKRINIDSYSQNDRDNHEEMIEKKYSEYITSREGK